MKARREGFITIISIFITFIALTTSLLIIKINRTKVRNLKLLKEKIQCQLALESFIEHLKFKLSLCLLDCNGCTYKGTKIFFDGRKSKEKFMRSEIVYSALDTRSKILVRTISPKILLKIFQLKNLPSEKAFITINSLMDWYDSDNIPRPNGAECFYYKSTLKAKYCPRNNRALQSIFELQNIRGFENFTENDLRDFFTDYSDFSINVNTAPRKILKLIFDDIKVQDILNKRELGICLNSANAKISSNIISYFPFRTVEFNICALYGKARCCAETVIDFSFQDSSKVYLKEFRYLF